MDRIKNKVYISETSLISSLGTTVAGHYKAINDYHTNIHSYNSIPVCRIDRSTVVEIPGYTFLEQLSINVLSELIRKTNIELSDNRTLLILSTTKGNVEYLDSDFDKTYLWSISNRLAEHFSASHKPLIVSNACVSGVAAIAIASRMIENGEYDNVFVLGVDLVSEFVVSGFNSFKSISPTICQPYNKDRDGLTIGEACGALLLTNDASLSTSGIQVCGGGISSDANHISGPSRTGDGLYLAIAQAMKDAGVASEQINCVNAHGTGTPFNDEMESKALKLANLDAVPCNSLKPYFGHTLGASGVIETIMLVEQMKQNIFFGVKGYTECGVPHPLNITAEHRQTNLDFAIKIASGFGGTNAAIVLGKTALTQKYLPASNPTTEIASIALSGKNDENFSEYIKAEYKLLGESNLKFFKMDSLSKLGYVASCKLLKDVDLSSYDRSRIGIVIANRSSSLDTDIKHQTIVNKHLDEGASPAIFVYTLANIVAAEISIKHKFQGELSVFVQESKDIEFLFDYSQKLINNDTCDVVLFGWCEYLNDNYEVELHLIKGN